MMRRFLICVALLISLSTSEDAAWGEAPPPAGGQEISTGEIAPAVATPSAPTPSRSGVGGTDQSSVASNIELLNMQAGLAENMYSMLQNTRTLSRLVSAYESLLQAACFPKLLRTLSHTSDQVNTECRGIIDKILAVDAGNPPAICARDGIDAESCRRAYLRQRVDTYDPEQDSSLGVDLDAHLKSLSNEQPLGELRSRLLFAKRALDGSPSADGAKEVLSLHRKIIALSCGSSRLLIEPASAQPAPTIAPRTPELTADAPAPQPTSSSSLVPRDPPRSYAAASSGGGASNPLTELALSLGQEPTPAPDDSERYLPRRVRLIERRCRDDLENAARFRSDLSVVWCNYHGSYSPQCIAALRKERAAPRTSGTPRPSGTTPTRQDFSTF